MANFTGLKITSSSEYVNAKLKDGKRGVQVSFILKGKHFTQHVDLETFLKMRKQEAS